MKKFFTLIAMTLITMGASAQTITFDETGVKAAGSVNELTLGDDNFKVALVGGSKASVSEKSLTYKIDASSEAENFKYQWSPGGGITKLSGERSVTITVAKAGALYIYSRSGGSDDRAFSVIQNNATILAGISYNGKVVEENYYKAYKVDVAAGTINITAESAINFSGFKFIASDGGSSEGDEGSGETTTVASWDKETVNGGTWSAVGTAVISGYTGKIHTNKDVVKCMTFPNSAWAKATTDATENSFLNYVKVEGEFKRGDVVTIQPYTAMSTADFTGGSKYATVILYDAEGKVIKDMTGSTASTLTVTDGHEEADEPKEFSYTLENEFTALCFGRQGNARINIIKIEIARAKSATAIQAVKTQQVNDGVMYNLSGQKVNKSYKGVVIINGKKMLNK